MPLPVFNAIEALRSLTTLKRFALALALTGTHQFAMADLGVTPVTGLQTYLFQGNCEDCATSEGSLNFPVTAGLVLNNYAPGQGNFGLDNFVSFSYVDSNLVLPVTWGQSDIFSVSGSFSGNPNNLIFAVNLRTKTGSLDDWGVKNSIGYKFFTSSGGNSGDANDFNLGYQVTGYTGRPPSKDFGTGTWSLNITSLVPEPETYAMFLAGLGLLGLSTKRRRQKLDV